MPNIALITVIHDPEGKNIALFKEIRNRMECLYTSKFITVSEETIKEWVEVLKEAIFVSG